jgi:hypothetical protein
VPAQCRQIADESMGARWATDAPHRASDRFRSTHLCPARGGKGPSTEVHAQPDLLDERDLLEPFAPVANQGPTSTPAAGPKSNCDTSSATRWYQAGEAGG